MDYEHSSVRQRENQSVRITERNACIYFSLFRQLTAFQFDTHTHKSTKSIFFLCLPFFLKFMVRFLILYSESALFLFEVMGLPVTTQQLKREVSSPSQRQSQGNSKDTNLPMKHVFGLREKAVKCSHSATDIVTFCMIQL